MKTTYNVSKLISRKFFKMMGFRAFQMLFDNQLIETNYFNKKLMAWNTYFAILLRQIQYVNRYAKDMLL